MQADVKSNSKRLYVVLSQTGTLLSRIIKLFTKAEYNHASISLFDDLSLMYSFGRVNPYNPFIGGFVTESPNFGTFKRFSKTKVLVIAFDVTEEKYYDMLNTLQIMYKTKKKFGYNYLGLYLAAIKVHRAKKNCYYCSEFVRWFLQKYGIKGAEKLNGIAYPTEFLTMPDFYDIYCGKLTEFKMDREVVNV